MGSEDNTPTAGSQPGLFPRTRWTLVMQMQEEAASDATGIDALNELCQAYWRPVYGFVRSWGKSDADAQDLTQGFFTSILSKGSLHEVAPEKGRLRTFLLVALKRFMANDHERQQALKRGGGQAPVSIDADWAANHVPAALASEDSPDLLFDRQWALTIMERAMSELRKVYASDGKEAVFEQLKFTISSQGHQRPLAEVATDLGISESAAKVASHRLRKRYRDTLHAIIADTLSDSDEVDEEIRYLMEVFRR